jgi:hypothetical protein
LYSKIIDKRGNNDFERVRENRAYKNFRSEFQLVAMDVNTNTSLFATPPNIEKNPDFDKPYDV